MNARHSIRRIMDLIVTNIARRMITYHIEQTLSFLYLVRLLIDVLICMCLLKASAGQNSDLKGVINSMKQLEERFNRKFGYPYVFLYDVFLYEVPFDDRFKTWVI